MAVTPITEKLAALRDRIRVAAEAAGRTAADVTIVAVSKTRPPAAIRSAYDAGIRHFGENYVQEAVPKVTQLQDGIDWHFIGTVQANKTRPIAEHFRWVQTIAANDVAGRLSRQRPFYAGDLQVLLQLRPEPGNGRGGVAASDLPELAARVAGMARLRLRGLMFMPLPGLGEAALRLEFRRARALYDGMIAAGHALDTLSMGMSDDLELAVAEGSTMIRIGTALFGAREG